MAFLSRFLACIGAVSALKSVTVKLPANSAAAEGRVLVYFQKHNDTVPMEGSADTQDTNQVFGVNALPFPSGGATIDATTLGYPLASLSDLKGGTYYAQAELVPYRTYARKDLPKVSLPTTCVSSAGSNGEYAKPDGTRYSAVVEVSATDDELTLTLDNVQPRATSPGCAGLGDGVESEFIKTVRVNSTLLEDFWGEPVQIEACVLVPYDFGDRPDATYPLAIAHGHYDPTWNAGGGFRDTKPATAWDDCGDDYDCVSDWYSYYLYKNWTDPKGLFEGAHMLVATLNHPVPLFDDSYAVNSAMLGPYGDAIIRELVPAIEARFRGIGQGWARGVFGGSTGGWESAATMVFYPDDYGFAHAACPDPVTFTHYTSLDIYGQANAFFYDSDFKATAVPGYRDGYSGTSYPGYVAPYGAVVATVQEMNRREAVLGTKGRSCGQWDIWEAVFGPLGEDGYQARLYDKKTGVINKTVAEAWRAFDLAAVVAGNASSLLPKLNGKLHFAVGASDSFYLTNAVMDFQSAVDGLGEHNISFTYGAHDGLGFQHCYRGDDPPAYDASGAALPNSITRLTYLQALLPKMARTIVDFAPAGADVESWRY